MNAAECRHQGVDPKKVRSIARRIAKAMYELDDLGLSLFGGTRALTIRGDDELILASMNECIVSGGDGGEHKDRDGLMRGEL